MHPNSAFISPIPLLVLRSILKQVTALKHSDTLGRIPGSSPRSLIPLRCRGISSLSSNCHTEGKASLVLDFPVLQRCHSHSSVSKVSCWRPGMAGQVEHEIHSLMLPGYLNLLQAPSGIAAVAAQKAVKAALLHLLLSS